MIAFISIPFSGLTGFTGACGFGGLVWFVRWVYPLPFTLKIPKKISTIINTITKQKKPFQCSVLKLSRKILKDKIIPTIKNIFSAYGTPFCGLRFLLMLCWCWVGVIVTDK
jgi:hypothetical protein